MKLQKSIVLVIFMALALLVSGCAKSNNLPEIPHPEATTTLPARTVLPTQTLSALTRTPIPSPTPAIIPTLSVDKARAQVLDFLANNGDCLLPCLWGIIPGESSFLETRAILMPFTSISTLTYLSLPESGGVYLKYTEADLEINTVIRFLIDPAKGNVSRIVFNASAQKKVEDGFQDVFNSAFFNERVGYYMLPNILATYGPPSDVLLLASANIPPQQPWWPFQIIISYPEQGVLVQYTTPMNVDDLNSIGCPTKSQIEIQLAPAGSMKTTAEFLTSNNYSNINLLKPIEEVTSLSVDEFFETFSRPTDKCIETPSKYWPPSF